MSHRRRDHHLRPLLVLALLLVGFIVSCKSNPEPPQAQPPEPAPMVLSLHDAPVVAPLPLYVPAALPEGLIAVAEERLDDRSDAGVKALDRFWLALPTQQQRALLWHLLHKEGDAVERSKGDARVINLAYVFSRNNTARGEDAAAILVMAIHSDSADTQRRAMRLSGDIGFDQQGPHELDGRLVPLLDALVTMAVEDPEIADRIAALRTIARFHTHPAPWAHKIAKLLDDPSPEIRRRAASTLGEAGPVAAIYAQKMLAQFDLESSAQGDQVGWMFRSIGWTSADDAARFVPLIRGLSESSPSAMAYTVENAGYSQAMADALLALAPTQLRNDSICYWIHINAKGDRRFVAPLLQTLKHDWVNRYGSSNASCDYTKYILKALVAAGQNDPNLPEQLQTLLRGNIPVNARLMTAHALSQLTGDPKPLGDALVRVLERNEHRAATYTDDHVLELIAYVSPADRARLVPYHQLLDDLVNKKEQGDPTGHLILTGDSEPVLAWARRDIKDASESNFSSSLLGGVSRSLGPLGALLLPDLVEMQQLGKRWHQSELCDVYMSIGPTPATRAMAPKWPALAMTFRPEWRIAPAMALWSCARDPQGALAILLPLLEDRSWGTVVAPNALAEMGHEAAAALPMLMALSKAANPAYARAAALAVERIEADLERRPTFDELWLELASDDVHQSLRAMARLSAQGRDTAAAITLRLDHDATPQLPGRRLRQQARARQVLELILLASSRS